VPEPVPATFDYCRVPPADRVWLMEKTGFIRHLSRAAANDLVAIGTHLNEVADRLRGSFVDWIRCEFTFGVSTAYKWMDVAAKLGTRVTALPIDPSALYMLAAKAKPAVVDAVVALAEAGTRVTPAIARSLLTPATGAPPADRRRHEAVMRKLDPETKATKDVTKDYLALWAAVSDLAHKFDRVTISRVKDSDDHERTAAGIDDHERGAILPFLITAVPADGPPVTALSWESLEIAVLKAAGKEPTRACSTCPAVGGLYTLFSKKGNNDEGRCPRCKACERKRVKRAKREMEARRRKAQESPAGRPSPAPSRSRGRGAG